MLLFVMLDGFRHDYVTRDDSPYLYELANTGLSGSAVPSFGFEPDAAYIAGLQPDEADGGAMFWLDPDGSPFRFARFLPSMLDDLPERPARVVRKGIRLIAQLLAHDARMKHWASPVWIPVSQLPRFGFSNPRLMEEPGFLPTPTIFDHLRRAGCSWYFHGMPCHRVAATVVQNRFLAEFVGSESYAFIHIGDLDGIGHRYGPWSQERKTALHNVDCILSKLVAHARARAGDVDLLILGDHGMVQVKHTLDVRPVLERLKTSGLVFDYFIDATFFRCWSTDLTILAAIRNEFNKIPGLMEIGESETLRYGLRYSHRRFWDACWQAEEGYVFTPNFHNNQKCLLAMHGYLPECKDNQSAFVLSSSRLQASQYGRHMDAVDMRRFFSTQLALLNLPNAMSQNWSLV